MVASFTWLDSSEEHRRQMRDVLSQFREQGTRDELGLAGVRDAFADLMFPGTGALQTRARYFFFVPWMYQDLDRRRYPANEIARRARKAELDLIEVLVEDGQPGTIGKLARRNLQRLPSSIYWSGMRRLGILGVADSQEQFHRRFDRYSSRARALRNDDGDIVDPAPRAWHPGVPSAPSSFPDQTSFDLERAEADFLLDRVRLAAPNSFFKWWLDAKVPSLDAAFAWDVPETRELPPPLRREMTHARNFSVGMYGATLLYSCLLTRMIKGADERADQIAEAFDQWHARFIAQADEFNAWDFLDLWRCLADSGARIGSNTRDFAEAWVGLSTTTSSAESLRLSSRARQLLEQREWVLKKGLARFRNPRALELWGGASGLRQIDYRWSSGVAIGRDIATALGWLG